MIAVADAVAAPILDWFIGERLDPEGAFKPRTGALPSLVEAGIAVRVWRRRWCEENPSYTILPTFDDPEYAFEVYGLVDGERRWIAEVRAMGFERLSWQKVGEKLPGDE